MKVEITLDFWDGSQSKTVTRSLDGTNITDLMFKLMSANVAGCTITKLIKVEKMIKKAKG